MKQMKWDVIMTSLLYVALGIVVLMMPGIMFRTLGYLIGAFLIVAGAVSMIGYLLRDARQNYFRNDFVYGLIEITIGIIVLYKVDKIMELVPVILGILVVASGCRKLQDVIDMKRMEYGNWIAMLVLAAVNVIFGVWLILDPIKVEELLERLIGIGLIVSGVTDCVIACYFAGKIIKYVERFEAVDSTCVEVTDVDVKAGGTRDENKKQASKKETSQSETAWSEASQSETEEKQDKISADGKDGIRDAVAGSEVKAEDKGEEQ